MTLSMSRIVWPLALLLVALVTELSAQQPPYDVFPPADPPYYRVRYEASTQPGELVYPVNYTNLTDTTPPPAPTNLRVHGNELSWEAEADLESGLAGFIIERDGQFLANVPEQGKNPFGRPIFQNLQYSDTPTQPLVPMRFTDTRAEPGKKHTYRVIAVNTAGLKSKPTTQDDRRGPGLDRLRDGVNVLSRLTGQA